MPPAPTFPLRNSRTTHGSANSQDKPHAPPGTGITLLAVKPRPKVKEPSAYKVLLLNDDFTPMAFVVQVLEQFFNKSPADAHTIMLHVHQRGVGLCGIYSHDVAETKVMLVLDSARRHQHPLQCVMEKA